MNRANRDRSGGLARALAMAGVLALACACDEAIEPPSLLEGDWGGDHVAVEATGDTVATRFDCAHGSIEAPVVLDRDGRFAASGEYVVDAGPSRPFLATYEGTVRGDRLDLRVLIGTVPSEPPDTAGPFVAYRGGEARVTYCR
jgi:hypothetical protein